MLYRSLASAAVLALAIAGVPFSIVPVAGQQAAGAPTVKPFTPPASTYIPTRTPWGDPDFQGVWDYQSRVPMQRPAELAGKARLTEQEFLERVKADRVQDACGFGTRAAEVCSAESLASPGSYNEFWNNRNYIADYRTSLIEDPPDGRIPSLTPGAQQRQRAIVGPRAPGRSQYETFTDFDSVARCIAQQTPNGPQMYNSGVLWVQSPGWIVMLRERLDTRIIPLDGRPHIDSNIQQWNGNSVGHFEGNTLVVETTNFTDKQIGGGAGTTVPAGISFGNIRVVERWVPVSATGIQYYATFEDATTWTRPWTFMLPWERQSDYQLFEFACHEANIGTENSLRTERQQERQQTEKPKLPVEQTSAGLVGMTEADLRARLGEPSQTEHKGAQWTYETVSGALVLHLFLEGGKVKIAQPNDLPLDQVKRP